MNLDQYNKILTEGAIIERINQLDKSLIDLDIFNAALVYNRKGKEILRGFFQQYINSAARHHLPLLLTIPTWRANLENLNKKGLDQGKLYSPIYLNDGNVIYERWRRKRVCAKKAMGNTGEHLKMRS